MSTNTDSDQVTQALIHRGGRWVKSAKDESWLKHHCLFHEDRHASASWQPDTRSYKCHAGCGARPYAEVCGKLGLVRSPRGEPGSSKPPLPASRQRQAVAEPRGDAATSEVSRLAEGGTGGQRPGAPSVPPTPLDAPHAFIYTRPDGIPTGVKVRLDFDDGSKRIWWDGGRPEDCWPIYDESALSEGQILVLLEGERKVDRLNAQRHTWHGLVVQGFTAGSTADLAKYVEAICDTINRLRPSLLLLWPDNDAPGIDIMRSLSKLIPTPHAVVEPQAFDLAPKQDVYDFLERGSDLTEVLERYAPSLKSQSNGQATIDTNLRQLIDRTKVASPKVLFYVDTGREAPIDGPTIESLWHTLYGKLPTATAIKQVRASLIHKGFYQPTRVLHRHFATQNAFYWRAHPAQPCYYISAKGVEMQNEPDDVVIVATEEPPFPIGVDMDGSELHWREFGEMFGLDPLIQDMILISLVSAFTHNPTPILFLKGIASSGKTTLATHLCALIDPDPPTLSARRIENDERNLISTAEQHPALLLDNISSASSDVQDQLSKFVTGESVSMRPLYENTTRMVHLQRMVVVTTVSWDVSKGDLSTRMWPVVPRIMHGYTDRRVIDRRLATLLPLLRGYVFRQCQDYYQATERFEAPDGDLRVGGHVAFTLGFDVDQIAGRINNDRASLMVEANAIMDALVDLGRDEKNLGLKWKPSELATRILRVTGESISPKMLHSMIRNQQPNFAYHGLEWVYGRTETQRYWEVRRL